MRDGRGKTSLPVFCNRQKGDSTVIADVNRDIAARLNTTRGIWQNFSENPRVRIPTLTDMSMSWDVPSRGVYDNRTMTLRPDVMMQNAAGISHDVVSTGAQLMVQTLTFNRLADLKSIGLTSSAEQLDEIARVVSLSPASAEHFLTVRGGRTLDREAANLADSFQNGFANMPSADKYAELLKRRNEIDGIETAIKDGFDPLQPIRTILDPDRGPRFVELLYGKPGPGEPDHYGNLLKKYSKAFRPSTLSDDEATAHVMDDLTEARQNSDRELKTWLTSYSQMPHAVWARERGDMVTDFFSK